MVHDMVNACRLVATTGATVLRRSAMQNQLVGNSSPQESESDEEEEKSVASKRQNSNKKRKLEKQDSGERPFSKSYKTIAVKLQRPLPRDQWMKAWQHAGICCMLLGVQAVAGIAAQVAIVLAETNLMTTRLSASVCTQALRTIDPTNLNMARLSECSDTHVLHILFILTGMKPIMKLTQLGCKTKATHIHSMIQMCTRTSTYTSVHI